MISNTTDRATIGSRHRRRLSTKAACRGATGCGGCWRWFVARCGSEIHKKCMIECTEAMAKRYQVSDGKMVLTLHRENNGWFVVSSPTDPAMITQARTIEE